MVTYDIRVVWCSIEYTYSNSIK